MTEPLIQPDILPQGVDGLIVRFSEVLDDAANLAAVTLSARLTQVEGIVEAAAGLASVYVRFDPLQVSRDVIVARITDALAQPEQATGTGRLWTVPCCFDGIHAPQLAESAAMAGVTPEQAVTEFCGMDLRVLALGFAPGQPYLGILPPHWNIPRQSGLTPSVPAGALTVAIRQFVLFANASPTGWRQVGRTGLRVFDLDRPDPFAFRPADRIRFVPVPAVEMDGLLASPMGGAQVTE